MEQQNTEAARPSLIERRKALAPKVAEIVGRIIGESDPAHDAELFDLGADSLDHVEIVMEVEKEFYIRIPDDQASELKTINQFADYLASVHNL